MPQQFDPSAMDAAGEAAEQEFFAHEAAAEGHSADLLWVCKWMERWYLTAGYKRLGRILVTYAKEAT